MFEDIVEGPNGYNCKLDGVSIFIPHGAEGSVADALMAAISAGADVTQEVPPPADLKLVGVEFEGVMCSATAADQNGLAAVLMAIQLQGAAFQPTRFYFENGNTLVLSLANYEAFAAVWLPFRQSFFTVN